MSNEIIFQAAAKELAKSFDYKQTLLEVIWGLAGDGNGTLDIPGREHFVYARLQGDKSRVVPALNPGFALSDGRPVDIQKKTNVNNVSRYQIAGYNLDVLYPDDALAGVVPLHAESHIVDGSGAGGWDPVWIFPRAIMPLRVGVQTTPDLTVQVWPGYYILDYVFTFFLGGSSGAFTPPGSGFRYDVIGLDTTGALQIVTGGMTTPVDFSLPLGFIPLAAVLLYAGQTAILESDIYDVRAFLSSTTTASPSGAFALTGVITPTTLAASVNNYNPTGLSTASTIRLSASAAVNITGLQGGTSGRILLVHNVGSFTITLENESALSNAANRFALIADNVELVFNSFSIAQYDGVDSRWRITAGGTGTASPELLDSDGDTIVDSDGDIIAT